MGTEQNITHRFANVRLDFVTGPPEAATRSASAAAAHAAASSALCALAAPVGVPSAAITRSAPATARPCSMSRKSLCGAIVEIASVVSSKMLGGASQTVSKICVKCNGT